MKWIPIDKYLCGPNESGPEVLVTATFKGPGGPYVEWAVAYCRGSVKDSRNWWPQGIESDEGYWLSFVPTHFAYIEGPKHDC